MNYKCQTLKFKIVTWFDGLLFSCTLGDQIPNKVLYFLGMFEKKYGATGIQFFWKIKRKNRK
jgi:hypothetical protein